MAHKQPCACCETALDSDDTASAGLTVYCPVADTIDILRTEYAIDIVAVLGAAAPLRYGELKDRLATSSDATLSRRLDQLEAAGIIAREQFDQIPPRVEYSLTDRGQELEGHLEPLLAWAADGEGD